MFTSNFIIGAIIVLLSIYTIYFMISVAFGIRDMMQIKAQESLRAKFQAQREAEAAKAVRLAKLFS